MRGIRDVPMSKSHKSISKIHLKVKQNQRNKLKRDQFILSNMIYIIISIAESVIDVKLSLIYQ